MFLPNLAFTVHQQAAAAPPAAEVEEDDDEGHKSALQRYKMVDARLRRLCERKGSGKLKVPPAIHEQWMAGGKQRDELRMLLEQFEFDKDPLEPMHASIEPLMHDSISHAIILRVC